MNYGWQEDGSFYIPPKAAKKFSGALSWLGHAENKNSLHPKGVPNTVLLLREMCNSMYEEFGFSHEEYT